MSLNLNLFKKKNKANEIEASPEDLLGAGTPFPVREAFNTLRTNVIFALAPTGGKTLLVTSSNPSEGKSTTASNLAVALAQNGNKVLLLDADMRKPKLHKFFSADFSHGLSRFLVGLESLNEVLIHTDVQNLDFIPSGVIPPNPSELLGSSRMKVFLDKMCDYYNYIIVDTPPINVVTDAAVLSKYVAGVLMVVHYGVTSRDDFKKSHRQLELAGANVIGFSLVAVKSEQRGGYSKNYYKKYYTYSSSSETSGEAQSES